MFSVNTTPINPFLPDGKNGCRIEKILFEKRREHVKFILKATRL